MKNIPINNENWYQLCVPMEGKKYGGYCIHFWYELIGNAKEITPG